jgi:hypothetical protein
MAMTLDHTEGNALSFDDASPAKGVTGWAPIDAGDGSFFDYVNVQLSIGFQADIDGNAVIHVRYSADSGTTDSDEGTALMEVTYSAGNTKILTIQLEKFNFVEIGIENDTSTEDDIDISGKWEGVKVTDS